MRLYDRCTSTLRLRRFIGQVPIFREIFDVVIEIFFEHLAIFSHAIIQSSLAVSGHLFSVFKTTSTIPSIEA